LVRSSIIASFAKARRVMHVKRAMPTPKSYSFSVSATSLARPLCSVAQF
jgi:hypothetical protein